MSSKVCTLTLTYAPRDDLADKILTPRHFQLFMKQLRNAGHKVRYFVAGEYGDLKQRTHFHAILFFEKLKRRPVGSPVPFYNRGHVLNPETSAVFSAAIPQMDMVHIREWPHGHVTCDWSMDERSVKYVCEYVLLGKAKGWISMSKKPALGAAWFAKKAETAKRLGVLPSSFEYLPPGGNRDRPYLMTGATRRDYLNAITQDENDRGRMSEWVQKTFDKYLNKRWEDRLAALPPQEQLEAMQEKLSRMQAETDKIILSQQSAERWADYQAAEWSKRIAQEMGFEHVEEWEAWRDETARYIRQLHRENRPSEG